MLTRSSLRNSSTWMRSFIQALGELSDSYCSDAAKVLRFEVEVADFYKITPNCLVSFAGVSFQDLSYQRARAYGVACKAVFLRDAMESFKTLPSGFTIQKSMPRLQQS